MIFDENDMTSFYWTNFFLFFENLNELNMHDKLMWQLMKNIDGRAVDAK